jgi:hypothetical protein
MGGQLRFSVARGTLDHLPFGAQVESVSDVRRIVTEYLAWYSYNEPWFGPASNAGVKTTAGAPAAPRRAVRHEPVEVNMDLATVDKLLTTTRSVRARLDLTHTATADAWFPKSTRPTSGKSRPAISPAVLMPGVGQTTRLGTERYGAV